MRIAYVNANYLKNHLGGGHVHMEQFMSNAMDLGHEIWVYPTNQYPRTYLIPTDRFNHIRTLRKMDVLYIRLEARVPEFVKWSLPPRRTLYGFPAVVWEFNTLPNEIQYDIETTEKIPKTSPVLQRYSKGCDLAICVTEGLANLISRQLNLKRVVTIPNGSNPSQFCPNAPVVKRLLPFKGKFNIVWIGTIKETWHDLAMLRDAADQVWKTETGINMNFHIIGAGLAGAMADMPPNVFYWGAELYNRLPNWLAGMDVGLSLYYPSRATLGSPLKIYDYMASGLTVVSTEHPVAEEIFNQLRTPELEIPFGDATQLANTLLELAKNRELVKQHGMAGRQLVIEKYNWHRAVQDTLNEMENLLTIKRERRR